MDGKLVTAGGRVFSVAATGPTLDMAVATAYKGVDSVQFANILQERHWTKVGPSAEFSTQQNAGLIKANHS